MDDKTDERVSWISSIDIIEKTMISRATLNNYIKMDILPKPVVDKPKDIRIRAKRVGYFPETVLDILDQVKRLKQDGYTMPLILEKLKHSSEKRIVDEALKIGRGRPDFMGGGQKVETDPLNFASVSHEWPGQSTPVLAFFCVLAADLQDASRLCAELPAEEYFEFVNQLWERVGTILHRHHGLCGRPMGQRIMLCYFLRQNDNHYLNNGVQCAMELHEEMTKLTMEWKTRKGWLNDLYLNIGINEGQEYVGFIRSPSGMEPTSTGESANQAIRLSEFARDGSIWLTKSLVNKLCPEDQGKIRYGIRRFDHHQGVFITNSFARIADMLHPDQLTSRPFADIETLAVTEMISKA
jgi:class 3 adenylate cyclase